MSDSTALSEVDKQLQEVLDREVSFRLQAIHDARAASARIKDLEEELEKTRQELGRRNTYIHQLHSGQEAEQAAREELIRDLGEYSQMLQQAENERLKLERRAHRWSEGFAVFGRAAKTLLGAHQPKSPLAPFAPPGDLTYYLYTSPYRIFRGTQATLRGWCYSPDGRQVTALRARLDDREYPGKWELEDPEVLKVHTTLPQNARPGFEVDFPTPPGRHLLSIEVCLDHRDWRSLFVTPIWVKVP